MTPEQQYVRSLLADAAKRAQQEAQVRRFELEEWERKHGFRRPADRLDANKALFEVRGTMTPAGAEK